MKKHVIILLAIFILLNISCSEKQDSLVNSNNNPPETSNVPTEVKSLLDNYAVQEEVNLSDFMNSPVDFDFSSLTDSTYDVYVVTFVWGKLINIGPPPGTPTDWSGSLSVNGPSKVEAISPIAFEHGQDSLIHDNDDFAEYWASTTQNDFDGMVFVVLYNKDAQTLVPQMLTFNTPPKTLQFDFDQLIHLYAYYQVDQFNSVAVFAHRIRLHFCHEGYFAGHWNKFSSSADSGTFAGHWFADNGDTVGVVNGHYWSEENGARLLAGHISGLYTDQIIAELHGIWYYDDYRMCPMCGAGHGQFKGVMVTNDGEHGFFHGEFGNYALPPDDLIMPFHGRWHLGCVNLINDGDNGSQ